MLICLVYYIDAESLPCTAYTLSNKEVMSKILNRGRVERTIVGNSGEVRTYSSAVVNSAT